MVCLRVLCARCAGAHSGQLCELLKCRDCRVRAVDGGTLTARTNELMKRVDEMEAMGARDSTMRTQRRGVQDYLAFCGTRGAVGLPATEFDLKAYVVWALLERTPRLDTSSIRTNLSGVSAWHVSLRSAMGGAAINPRKALGVRSLLKIADSNYKLPSKAMECMTYAEWLGVVERGYPDTRSGRQRRLLFVLCTVCPLRPAAAAQLVITYRVGGDGSIVYGVDSQVEVVRGAAGWAAPHLLVHLGKGNARADKNVDAMHTRSIPVPCRMLGCNPVELLEAYVINERPPSGNRLLTAPLGATGFRSTAYTAACKAAKDAYVRAHPAALAADVLHVGGSSPRKSMTQWLWEAGHSKRAISDMGGWRSQKEGVDYYFTTSKLQMLQIKTELDPTLPPRTGRA